MKKKYILSFTIISIIVLIIALIVGGFTLFKAKDSKDDAYFEINDIKVTSFNKVIEKEYKIKNYNFSSTSTSYVKTYEYEVDEALEEVTLYYTYLVENDGFTLIQNEDNEVRINKDFAEKGNLYISILYGDSNVIIQLEYFR